MGVFTRRHGWAGLLVLALGAPAWGQTPRELYDYHFEQGGKFQHAGRPKEALPHFQAAVQAALKAGGIERADRAFYNMGLAQAGCGMVKEKFETMTGVEAWRRKNLGDDDPETILVLRFLSVHYGLHNELLKAKAYAVDAVKQSEKRFGADSTQVAEALMNLALAQRPLGEYADVVKTSLRCLAIREARLGPKNYWIREPLQWLAMDSRDKGEYTRAEAMYQRIAGLEPRKDGNPITLPMHRVTDLTHLADFYTHMGRYLDTEALYREKHAILLQLAEREPPTYAPLVVLNQLALADLYLEMGLPDRAFELYRQILPELERLNQRGSVSYALQGMGRVHHLRGELEQAAQLFDRSYKAGEEQRNMALLYADFGALQRDMGNYDFSVHLFTEAVKYLTDTYGAKSTFLTPVLLEQAKLEGLRGNRPEAEKLYQRVISAGGAVTAGNPNSSDARLGQARLAWAAGERQPAISAVDQSRREMRRYTRRVLPALGEHEQLQFLAHRESLSFREALGIALAFRDDRTAREAAAGWVVNSKGLAQEAIAQRTLLARGTNDPRLMSVTREWLAVRFRLAKLAVAGTTGDREQADLAAREQALAAQLGRTSAADQADPWVELSAIREKIPADALLVEIVRYAPLPPPAAAKPAEKKQEEEDKKEEKKAAAPRPAPPPARYLAWVIPPAGPREVQFVDLGLADEIDQAVAAARKPLLGAAEAILDAGEAEAEQAAQKELAALSKRLLEPLRPHLADSKHWILSPDAGLWLVPWSALSLEENKYLVESHVTRFVVSGRDLVEQAGKPASGNAPLVLADPDFDLTDKPAEGAGEGARGGGPLDADDPRTRTTRSTAVRSAVGAQWQRLPGTAREAKDLEPKLAAYTGSKVELHAGRAAVEQVIRDAWQPRVAVLSTHGFFLERPAAGGAAELESPLVRCGLVLAGANRRAQAAGAAVDDGILTGLEIVGADLRGTELVVLSACETGLGEVRAAEGVVGLRQAFQLAGAQSVLASLWRVPDADTAQLMGTFYDRLAATGDKAVALREAQRALLQSHRKASKSAHPYYWAAFTLTGRSDRPEVAAPKPRPARVAVRPRVRVISATAPIMDGAAQVALAKNGDILEITGEQGEWLLTPITGRAKPAWILKRNVQALEE